MLLGAILEIELSQDAISHGGRDAGLLHFLLHSVGEELMIGILENEADDLSNFNNSLSGSWASE